MTHDQGFPLVQFRRVDAARFQRFLPRSQRFSVGVELRHRAWQKVQRQAIEQPSSLATAAHRERDFAGMEHDRRGTNGVFGERVRTFPVDGDLACARFEADGLFAGVHVVLDDARADAGDGVVVANQIARFVRAKAA